MKKLLAIVLFIVFTMSMAACAGGETQTNAKTEESSVAGTASTSDNAQWKQFLKDYEAWVDDYIALMKKYEANPTDASILADYTEMMNEVASWTTRAEEVQKELEASPEDLAEYTATLARIAEKLAEAAY